MKRIIQNVLIGILWVCIIVPFIYGMIICFTNLDMTPQRVLVDYWYLYATMFISGVGLQFVYCWKDNK